MCKWCHHAVQCKPPTAKKYKCLRGIFTHLQRFNDITKSMTKERREMSAPAAWCWCCAMQQLALFPTLLCLCSRDSNPREGHSGKAQGTWNRADAQKGKHLSLTGPLSTNFWLDAKGKGQRKKGWLGLYTIHSQHPTRPEAALLLDRTQTLYKILQEGRRLTVETGRIHRQNYPGLGQGNCSI